MTASHDVQVLLSANADTEISTVDNTRPLQVAIYSSRVNIVRLLLEAGAKQGIVNSGGNNDAMLASFLGEFEIMKLLRRTKLVNAKCNDHGMAQQTVDASTMPCDAPVLNYRAV